MRQSAQFLCDLEAIDFPLLGARAKALRLTRGLSIRQLAKRAGVDKNTILRLEHGLPVSDRVLVSVCRSLETVVTSLMVGALEPMRVRVFRGGDAQWFSIHQLPEARGHLPNFTAVPDSSERERYGRLGFVAGFLMMHSCAISGGKILAGVYEVHRPNSLPYVHGGEEFIYCLGGEVRVTVGEETHDLREGDSVSFDSSLPHNFERVPNAQGLAPRVLSVWVEGATVAKQIEPAEPSQAGPVLA